MDTPLIALLAKFVASEPGRPSELVNWLLANGHFSQDIKAFVLLVTSECEQHLLEDVDLMDFEEVAASAWEKYNE